MNNIEKYNDYLKHIFINNNSNENRKLESNYNDDKNDRSSEKKDNNKNQDDKFFISPYIGIIGVDLSSKMLIQSRKKNCYADTVVSDVTLFVQNYAKLMRTGRERTNIKNKNNVELEDKNDKNVKNPIDNNNNKNKIEIENENDSHPAIDFIVAADVFMYLGDLKNILESSYKILKSNGLLVFTVEALENKKKENEEFESDKKTNGEKNDIETDKIDEINEIDEKEKNKVNFSLKSSGRIAHSYHYLKEIAIQSNYTILELSEQFSRKDKGVNVKGYLVVLRK